MKSLYTFLLTVLLITGIGGCSKCGDGYYENINEMYLSVLPFYGYNSIPENYPIAFDSLVIETNFSGIPYATIDRISSGFLPTALASDDCPGSLGSKETIKNITVITLMDFDNNLKANDTINSIIQASQDFYNGYVYNDRFEFKDLSRYVAEIKPGIFTNRQGDGGAFYLSLKNEPTQKVIKLRVDVAFTNGKKYSAQTIPITIK